MNFRIRWFMVTIIVCFLISFVTAQEGSQNEKPGDDKGAQGSPASVKSAMVVTAPVTEGSVTPERQLIGTIYYIDVSDVSSEVAGKVEKVSFEEGLSVKKDEILIKLNDDLLKKSLEGTKANLQETEIDIQLQEKNLERLQSLYESRTIEEKLYDEQFFTVQRLRKRVASLQAGIEEQELELEKKTVQSPFSGIVLARNVEVGEWVAPGMVIASIAKDDMVELIVNVSQEVIPFLKKGAEVPIRVNNHQVIGKIFAIIPRGDIATRTFPVKIRILDAQGLFEGMEAIAKLPAGEEIQTLRVPRDAVINMMGQQIVFAVQSGQAMMIPVQVLGYKGLYTGISAQGLEKGMQVVIKGNERLRPGQPVIITTEEKEQE